MSDAMERYRIKSGDIMHEIIDGEAVIINIDQGTYYSVDGVGAFVWQQLTGTVALDSIVERVAQHYSGDHEQMRSGVAAFLVRLEEEGLIEVSPGPESADPPPSAGENGDSYSDPELNKYTDMEQLLLLDPIHEVEDSGWPNIK